MEVRKKRKTVQRRRKRMEEKRQRKEKTREEKRENTSVNSIRGEDWRKERNEGMKEEGKTRGKERRKGGKEGGKGEVFGQGGRDCVDILPGSKGGRETRGEEEGEGEESEPWVDGGKGRVVTRKPMMEDR